MTVLFSCGTVQADFEAQCLQEHRGLRLTEVQITPFIQTDVLLFAANSVDATAASDDADWADDEAFDDQFGESFAGEGLKPMPDPLQVVNRPFFTFNDKMYFWVLKPVARGYGWIVPEPARNSVKKFFYNLRGADTHRQLSFFKAKAAEH